MSVHQLPETEAQSEAPIVATDDELDSATIELIRNGEPINWKYWASRQEISPRQGAKLAYSIDPIKWPDDKKYAQGEVPDHLRENIGRLAGWLEERNEKWSLTQLVVHIDPAAVPHGMMSVVCAETGARPEAYGAFLTKREQQIRAIEDCADRMGYQRLKIPTGGKAEIRKECRKTHPKFFGGGDDPFDAAWKEARKQSRIRMKDHEKFAKR